MGKGNRVRLEKAQQAAANQSVFTAKKQKKVAPAWVSTLVVVLVIALLLSCVALTIVSDGGYVLRWTTVAESEHYKVTGTMLSYYFYQSYSYFLSQFGTMASYIGLDTNKSLKDQVSTYGEEEGTTWFDYFMEPAIEDVKSMLVYCEEAHKRGIKLEDEDRAIVDSALEALEAQASEYGYTVSGFIAAMYGTGVKKSDVRAALELSQLAVKCQEQIVDEITLSVTDEDINVYYEANAVDFQTAGVLSYTFTATLGDDAEAFAQKKAEVKKHADELAACKTVDEYKQYVLDYVAEKNYATLYDKEVESLDPALLPDEAAIAARRQEIIEKAMANALKGEGAEEIKTEDKVEALFNEIEVDLTETLANVAAGMYNERFTVAADAEDEASLWIAEAARAAGDTKIIEVDETLAADDAEDEEASDDKEDAKEYTATVYMIAEPMHRDETPVRNVGHILFKPATYENSAKAKAKAEEVLDQFLAGDKTREAFEKLAQQHTEDSSVFYDNVAPGQMVAPFENWLFDEARKDGDTGIVETSYGHHIMYYLGEEADMPAWKYSVQSTIVNEKAEKWFTDNETTFEITIYEAKANKVNA